VGFHSQNGAISGSTALILKFSDFSIFKAEPYQEAESNPDGFVTSKELEDQ
jgi:hypothetical protein